MRPVFLPTLLLFSFLLLCLCACMFVCVCVCVCVHTRLNQIETPMLNLAKRVDHWTWDPNEERRRQERWQQEQERLLQVQ